MREFTEHELFNAIAHARSLDETAGRQIIDRFQLEQPALAQMVFNLFPMIIAAKDQDMSHLFMDLCFDVICVFETTFGPIPSQSEIDVNWLEKQATLLDTELKAMMADEMNPKIRHKLKDRFAKREIQNEVQPGLTQFINMAIDDFASESPNRAKAVENTQSMMDVVIRLFNSLYEHTR